MYYNKVEICGVNTAKLKTLSDEEKKTLLIQAKNAFGSMENVDKIILSLSTFMLAA